METRMQRRSPSLVESMRKLHPPPADVAADPSLREWVFSFDVPVPSDALWRVVSDTSRINRALGLDEMFFEERDGVLHGSNRSLGLAQAWVETPWSWVQDSHLTTVRRYSRGMARSVFASYRLEPSEDGASTRFIVYFGWVPRGLLGALLVQLGMWWLGRRYDAVVDGLARSGKALALPPPPPPTLEPESRARALECARKLRERGLDTTCVDRLVELVTSGDELDLDRIAPLELVHAFGVDEQALIETCLHATRVGLLDMRWEVVCPHCRGVRESVNHLGEIPAESRCEVCEISFRTSPENAVAISFRPHPTIRAIEHRFYCSAEPATKRHVEVQVTVDAGASETVPTRLRAGRHRIRIKGSEAFARIEVLADRAPGEVVEFEGDAPLCAVATGPSPTLRLVARSTEATTFVVETPAWSETVLRPGRVLSMQGFRDLFAQEYLAANVQLEVGEQTIVFTDIVGSTAFYGRHGDPAAFALVKAHFDAIYAIVARHRGAIVKTIGDATMAAFSNPMDAIEAAREIQRAFEGTEGSTIRLRIAMHTGPCIAVQFHQGIDYFGGTVNLAAKLQSLASAGEVVLSHRTYEALGVRARFEADSALLEEVEYSSSAFPRPVAAKRWRPVIGR